MQLKEFQEKAIEKLLDYSLTSNKNEFILQAPTGAGKTIILLNYMDRLVNDEYVNEDFCFIWLTPGAGELEEQSFDKLNNGDYQVSAKHLSDALNQGFQKDSCYFINYEQVTKEGNKSTRESEMNNIYDQLQIAHDKGLVFVLIVDEEHKNKTTKAEKFISHINPEFSIRVSATPILKDVNNSEYYQIDTQEVIDSGLLTKHVYVNYEDEEVFLNNSGSELSLYLDLAIKKQEEIKKEYENINVKVNPLVIIQISNEKRIDENENLKDVVRLLEERNISVDKGNLAIWLDKEKENLENITENNNEVSFIICKQAIATGWDCPRAKVLVKLRTNSSDTFEIQTIGRIRRMPQGKHYDNDILDNAYIYTYDENFIIDATDDDSPASLSTLIDLKTEYRDKDFGLIKEYCFKTEEEYLTGEYSNQVSSFMKKELQLNNDTKTNIEKLREQDYDFDINGVEVIGKGVYTSDEDNEFVDIHFKRKMNMTDDRIKYYKAINSLGNKLKIKTFNSKKEILEGIFSNKSGVLRLKNVNQLAAFIIKNYDNLKNIFINFMKQEDASLKVQSNLLNGNRIEEKYYFPNIIEFNYKVQPKDEVNKTNTEITNNIYNGFYDNAKLASNCEYMFLGYISNNSNIKWFFKNLDSGQQGFSIIYQTGDGMLNNFFPDWILMDKNDNLWIIETKGGEGKKNVSKDIDEFSNLKFMALKEYANKYGINFAFVRDKGKKLYYSNTEYIEEMNAVDKENKKVWKPLKEIISEK